MLEHLRRIGSAETGKGNKSGGIRLSNIRPERAPYLLAYAFELMLYGVWQTFLPVEGKLLGLSGGMVLYVCHVVASVVVMLLWSERFQRLLYVSVAVLVAGFVPFLLLPAGALRAAFGMLALAGLGCAVTCARCGFAFAANNTERMVGILLMTVAVVGIYLLDALGVRGAAVTKALPLALVAALAFCLLRFRERDLTAKERSDRADARGLYWALAFMIVYFSIDSYAYSLIDTANRGAYILFCAGMALSAIVFFAVLVRLRGNVLHLWTLFFLFAVLMAVFALLAPQLGTPLPHHLFCGLSILGWPLSLYMLACAQRRYASYRLLKRCTLIFAVLSPLTTISDEVVESFWPEKLPAVALVYVLFALALFLLTLPQSYRTLFSDPWIAELSREDMAPPQTAAAPDLFAPYGLTPREREVAVLLLAAKTRRQIAGELGLTEATVKTHTANLYKKLGVSSRIELFRAFGAPER